MTTLTPELATRMATSTLAHLGREYPHHQAHLLNEPADATTPRANHPIFFGSYDWHSCVHGWWQVVRIARLFPDLPIAAAARARADTMLVPEHVAGEIAYFERSGAAAFERPYGWAWLLALHLELGRAPAPWAMALEPLARLIGARLADFLPRLTYPVRHGVHANTAFALLLAHPWAAAHDPALAEAIAARAAGWYGTDRAAPTIEPSGEDFLSPTLTVAALMARVLPPEQREQWAAAHWRDVDATPLHTPAIVADRTDPRIAHLDGLNLSRAWCWRIVAPDAPDLTERHLAASFPFLTGDYMGEHWLASFALLALSDGP